MNLSSGKVHKNPLELAINWFAYLVLLLTVAFIIYAAFPPRHDAEAAIGSFDSYEWSDGWMMERVGAAPQSITLPIRPDVEKGELITIRNTIPADVSDEMNLMIRASMEDVYVSIDGQLREKYASESAPGLSYYLPSSYLVVALTDADAGKEITITYRIKSQPNLEIVQISHGNNGWFSIIKNNSLVFFMAFLVLVMGIVVLVYSLVMRWMKLGAEDSFRLSLLLIDIGIWILSESKLRQLIFSKSVLSSLFSYSSMEVIAILSCQFFDEVQNRRHHRYYLAVEGISAIQIAMNFGLHFTGVMELYDTLIFSHMIIILALILTSLMVASDIRSGAIHEYRSIAFGMLGFLLLSVAELAAFYIKRNHVFGSFLCTGLIILMLATFIQSLSDQISLSRKREDEQEKMIVNTIQAFAGTIDAKDEYTGGHSERVGEYAAMLAKGVASEYDLTEEDIERIRYIGAMHDIGKIGVPDNVLNKEGLLTDIEYSLMKKHVIIGSEMMSGLGESMKDLVGGVRYHHERFDGRGYPEGLVGTDIPLIARIICLADSYDAMTSNRIYRNRLSNEAVRAEIVRCSGTQFDPTLASFFVKMLDSGEIHPLSQNS